MLSLDSSNESRDQEEGRGRKTEERINPLSILKGELLRLSPFKRSILARDVRESSCAMTERLDEAPVEVGKAEEG